jgi:hypothetical protein
VRLTGLDQGVPQLDAVTARIGQVDLVAQLARVAGAGDDERHAVQLAADHVVVRDVEDLGAEEIGHDLLGLGALDLEWPHVRL